MRVDNYYDAASVFNTAAATENEASAEAAAYNFLASLMQAQSQGAQAIAETADEVAEIAPIEAHPVPATDPVAAAGAQSRVNQVNLDEELGLTISSGLSPEAAEKKAELMARLEELAANNKGVSYRVNEDLFQKMADDPEYEKRIYEAVAVFEQSIKSTPAGGATAMYVGPEGDWVSMSSALEGGTWQDSTWDVKWSSVSGKAPESAADLQEWFPNMEDELAEMILKALQRMLEEEAKDSESELEAIQQGWEEYWDTQAAALTANQSQGLLPNLEGMDILDTFLAV